MRTGRERKVRSRAHKRRTVAQVCWGRCQDWSKGCWAGPEAAGVVTERDLMGAKSRGGETTQEGQVVAVGAASLPSVSTAVPSRHSALLGKPRFAQVPASLEGLQQVPGL